MVNVIYIKFHVGILYAQIILGGKSTWEFIYSHTHAHTHTHTHTHSSTVNACDILVKALHDGGGLNAGAHKACVREARNQARKARLNEEETYLNGLKLSGGGKVGQTFGTDGRHRSMAIGHPQSL